MKIIFLRDNSEYELDEGAVITQNYNETLDSAYIKISNLGTSLDLEPYDKVKLEETPIGDLYFCIDTFTEKMICNNPVIYNYEISLFSQTKLLEGIILPNLSITQLRDGSAKRTVWDYIEQYVKEYALFEEWYVEDEWYVNRVKNRFEQVECPEMQWNMPTLREVLNSLMMVGDCIVIMVNSKIDYIDITEKKNRVYDGYINYIQKSQSSADYVSELQMNMVNVIQEDADVKSLIDESFSSDNPLIKDDNILLRTKFPILKLKSLVMSFYVQIEDTVFEYSGSYNLMNFLGADNDGGTWQSWYNPINLVYENDEYVTKEVYNIDSLQPLPEEFYQWELYQNFCLKYNRYGNTIEGFNITNKVGILQLNWNYLENLKEQLLLHDVNFANYCEQYGISITSAISLWKNNSDIYRKNDWRNTTFNVEYETTASQLFRASKTVRNEVKNRNKRVVIDNQTNSFVDAGNQGNLEYMKANRLGNKQLIINGRFIISMIWIYPIPQIGFYYPESDGDNIIYQCEYQVFKEHIEFDALATKDYLLKDYFTGIKAKVRTWVNAKDEALERHDLDKYYLEFSEEIKTQDIYQTPPISDLKEMLDFLDISIGDRLYANILKYSAIQTLDKDGNTYPEQNYEYIMPVVGRVIGNSLVFTFGFNNNYSVDKKIDSTKIISGGLATNWYMYADKNIENIKTSYRLATSFNNAPASITIPTDVSEKMAIAFAYPKIPKWRVNDYVEINSELNIHKDNREITKISTQLEFCSDTDKIEFSKRFVELCKYVRRKEIIVSDIIPPSPGYLQYRISLGESVNIGAGNYKDFRCQDDRFIGANDFNFLGFVGYHNWTATLVSFDNIDGVATIRISNPTQYTVQFRVETFNWTATWYQFKIYEDGVENPSATLSLTNLPLNLSLKFELEGVSSNKVYEIRDGTGTTLLKAYGLREFYLNILKWRN